MLQTEFLIKNEGYAMKVYLLKDIENLGMAGQVVKVADGYANNFLLPKKIAVKVNPKAEEFFRKKEKV